MTMARRPALLLLLLLVAAAVITTTVGFRSLQPRQQQHRQQRHWRKGRVVMRERAPTGLTLDEVSSKLKFEVTDLDEGIYGLESKDPDYAIEIAKVKLPLAGGLGIGLEELRRGRDGRGCVLVSSVVAGGNADKSEKVLVGDMVCYLGKEPTGMVRVEGYDYDGTIDGLQSYISTGASSITLVLKRLVKRQTLTVAFQFEPTAEEAESGMKGWTKEVPMLAGSNLRKEMLRQGFSVYDKKTKRFDQPFVQGDCGGEGLCGTCLVQVLQGKELLNKPDGVEEMVLKKWQAPTWRLGCRCVVGAINEPGFVKFKLQPQKPFIK